ncbi:MAG: sugar phosphate isomerase/epimerase [Clostridia bacterium]|nr:sugar phosphate isomerase/epimerase [Clostridia bacterium]
MKYGMPTLIEFDTIEENAALCAELGLDFIDLNMNLPQFQPDASDVDNLLRLSEKYGISYTIHLDENLNVCDFNSYVSEAYLCTVKDAIGLALRIGAGILNMHLSKGVYFTLPDKKIFLFEKYKDAYMKKMIAFRNLCERVIGDTGIKICIENCGGFLPFHIDAADELLKSDVFALTWDIGHDHCTGGKDGKFILEHRDRLAHMHVHDAVNSSGVTRDHLALGEGGLVISKYLSIAEELGCSVVIETKTSTALRRSAGFIRSI